VHYKDEGSNLAGQKHIDHIRAHKEGGIFDYKSVTTGQEKIVAYRYIDKWGLWVVPGVNKADYFQQLKQLFIKWNVVFAVVLIIVMTLTSFWINRTVTNPLKGMLRIFKDTGGEAGSSAEARELVSRLLGNLLYSGRS